MNLPSASPRFLLVALAGLFAGALLERWIRRVAFQKSMLWPWRSYCENCYQPLPLVQSVPILGWFYLLGRCPSCRKPLGVRSLFLPVFTAVCLVLLYQIDVAGQGHFLPEPGRALHYWTDRMYFALFVYHALLFCFLIAATFTDFDVMLIPLPITLLGTAFALLLGTFWYYELHPVPLWVPQPWADVPRAHEILSVERWQKWFNHGKELPGWIEASLRSQFVIWHWRMNWNRYLGLATGLAGLIVGRTMVWAVREVCSRVFGKEAMGIGDIDLMGMVGAFLGWQAVVLAFCLAPVSGILLGLPVALARRGRAMPFGPHLAFGAAMTVVFWRPLWANTAPLFLDFQLFFYISLGMLVLLAATALFVEGMKRLLLRIWGVQRISGNAAEAQL